MNAMPFGDALTSRLSFYLEGCDERNARLAKIAERHPLIHSHQIQTVHTNSLRTLFLDHDVGLEPPDVFLTYVVSGQCSHYGDFAMLSDVVAELQEPPSSMVIDMPGEFHFNGKDYKPDATLLIASQMSSADKQARMYVDNNSDDMPSFIVAIHYTALLHTSEKGSFMSKIWQIADFTDTITLPCPLNHTDTTLVEH